MLKKLDPLLNGALLQILADMGHGDELVIVDANYPAAANAKRLVRLDGITATAALDAVLSLLPLDDFVEEPAAVMTPGDERPPVLDEFQAMVDAAEGRPIRTAQMERFAFYERARGAYAVIATGERRLYGNIILVKGVIRPGQ
ncbi:fucose binding protein [Skermanella stibiiresistens SB22]|uniref:Fucose binding protein n=1 Tax=Skermanella stibiiresistens SB22 TaxID=1385369 RepID=W9GZV5_9PROT|nr:RbsD/FucU domain-containing protein [Skermanella stibiiresistens]EWY39465.1 fucose binding protein [Skermanella stibiiresistens SB22]